MSQKECSRGEKKKASTVEQIKKLPVIERFQIEAHIQISCCQGVIFYFVFSTFRAFRPQRKRSEQSLTKETLSKLCRNDQKKNIFNQLKKRHSVLNPVISTPKLKQKKKLFHSWQSGKVFYFSPLPPFPRPPPKKKKNKNQR